MYRVYGRKFHTIQEHDGQGRKRGFKKTVIVWLQRRCQICKRFLSKRQIKFCEKCAIDKQRGLSLEYYHKNSEQINLRRRNNSEFRD
jgi:hypothetical protein